jgi:hypothetical protein
MATLSITIPDAVLPRIQAVFGSQAELKAAMIAYIKGQVVQREGDAAKETAREAVESQLGLS